MAFGYPGNGETFFHDVRVPAGNLIGEENQGWYVAMTLMDFDRGSLSDTGEDRRALARLIDLVRTDEGKQVSRVAVLPTVRAEIADRVVEAGVGQSLAQRVASMQAAGLIPNYEASIGKCFSTELHQRRSRTGTKASGLYANLWGATSARRCTASSRTSTRQRSPTRSTAAAARSSATSSPPAASACRGVSQEPPGTSATTLNAPKRDGRGSSTLPAVRPGPLDGGVGAEPPRMGVGGWASPSDRLRLALAVDAQHRAHPLVALERELAAPGARRGPSAGSRRRRRRAARAGRRSRRRRAPARRALLPCPRRGRVRALRPRCLRRRTSRAGSAGSVPARSRRSAARRRTRARRAAGPRSPHRP